MFFIYLAPQTIKALCWAWNGKNKILDRRKWKFKVLKSCKIKIIMSDSVSDTDISDNEIVSRKHD